MLYFSMFKAQTNTPLFLKGKERINMDEDNLLNFLKYVFNISKELMEEEEQINKTSAAEKSLVCFNCNLSYRDFQKTGKLGCEKCYDTFRSQLIIGLKNIHGDNVHRGEIPKNGKYNSLLVKKTIEEYRQKLTAAVETENYEEAANIRDRIRLLEKEI